MVNLKELGGETIGMFFIAFILSFLLINFNPDIGIVYSHMISLFAFGLVIFVITQKVPNYSKFWTRPGASWSNTILYLGVAIIAFQLLSGFAFSAFSLESQSVFANIQASAPVLSGNDNIQFATFGWVIPIVESPVFFAILIDVLLILFLGNRLLNLKELSSWAIILLVSAAFTIFHLNAKLASGNAALIQTFIFAVISIVLVAQTKQMREMVLFHIFVNSWAVKGLLGLTLFSSI